MNGRAMDRVGRLAAGALSVGLVLLLLAPVFALALASSPAEIRAGIGDPMFWPALSLSLRTTLISLGVVLAGGAPLAWWLSRSRSTVRRAVEVVVALPIVIPPAVLGVALLQAFGRSSALGRVLDALGVVLPFTEPGVVVAQVVVSGPFFVLAAMNAFRNVSDDTILVARSLGASPATAFLRVALPLAWPGVLAGAAIAWARSLGEFGATLLFAGNLSGRTQTMPLAIYTALERDVQLAVVFALVMLIVALALLALLRLAPGIWRAYTASPGLADGREGSAPRQGGAR